MTESTKDVHPDGAALPHPAARSTLRWAALALAVALVSTGVFWLFSRAAPAPAPAPTDVPTSDGRAILLSPKFKERLGLKTTVVREVPLTPVVKVAGTVDFDPRYVAAVGSRLKGLVRSVTRFEGDVVREGELLAEIDSPELGSAQAGVLMYRAQKRAAELNHERERDLSSRGLTTAREVEEAAATLEEFRSKLIAAEQQVSALGGVTVADKYAGRVGIYQLKSPLAGTVVERHVSPGQSVEGHLTAFRVANLDHLWIELSVFERNLDTIRKGDRVELLPLSNKAEVIVGQVAHIGEQLNPETRTAPVRVEVDNRERKLRPGQAVTARIQPSGGSAGAVEVVPSSALTYVDGKPTVFVAETELKIVATPVELGETDGQSQEITSGLSAGQVVVSEGVFGLKSELFR